MSFRLVPSKTISRQCGAAEIDVYGLVILGRCGALTSSYDGGG